MFNVLFRCRYTHVLLLAALLGMSFSAIAQTGHGIGILKECDSPVRICSADNQDVICPSLDECTTRQCDLSIPDTVVCRFTATYNDSFGDTISILQAFDNLDPFGTPIRSPSVGDARISDAGGNTTCVVGAFAPCSIGPDQGGGAGFVEFTDDNYVPSVDAVDPTLLPDPLVDQALIQVQDQCDGTPDAGCNTGTNFAAFTSQTDLVDGCIPGDPIDCDDGDACTIDACVPETGCMYTPVVCDDGDVCTTDTCDPATGCVFTPGALNCDDNDVCTTDTCDPITGCVNTPGALDCDDNDVCTTDTCDPITGCVNTPGALDCDDNDVCTTDTCDPITGCVNTPGALDCDDNDVCTTDTCDPITGCVNTPGALNCDDNDVCTTDICDPIDGCVNTPGALNCDDGDICTDDFCDPIDGCFSIPADPLPPECVGAEICRTPGFWGARGGTEKSPKSQNITQAVIDSVLPGGLEVCGTFITNTDLGSSQSAIEAVCVSVKGVQERQLVRQLTAAALNCVLGDCSPATTTLVADCNTVCDTGVGDMGMCIDALDCFNNGGVWDSGSCLYNPGYCAVSGALCEADEDCAGFDEICELVETCHDRDLCPDFDDDGMINGSDFCFEPPGPASSPKKCNAARKNGTYVP